MLSTEPQDPMSLFPKGCDYKNGMLRSLSRGNWGFEHRSSHLNKKHFLGQSQPLSPNLTLMYECMCVCVCMYVCVYACLHVYMQCVCVCICIYSCTYIYVCMCACIYIYVCMHAYVLCVYVCISCNIYEHCLEVLVWFGFKTDFHYGA